ncbi:MAG TPA: PIN domain-containing protein [Puia sp.]|nr:PIN domain-containing protein [Puia sp.]
MAFRIFFGTDVLLDYLLKGSSYGMTRDLVQWAVAGRVQVFVSSAILRDIGPALQKAYGTKVAKQLLLTLIASVQIIDAGLETTVIALQSKIEDIPGAISYYTALHHRLDYFITWSYPLFPLDTPALPVTTPIDFLNKHGAQLAKIY